MPASLPLIHLRMLFAFAVFASTCALAAAAPAALSLPVDWYPESVTTGPDGSFYVGSWRQGAVARLRPDTGRTEVLVKPGANGLANGQGVLVDAKHGALWVCSGNSGFTTVPRTPSALKRYDLTTGAAQASYLMPEDGHCNDLAQDARGSIYVTDSLHPRLLRLARGAPQLAIWAEGAALDGGGPYPGLNGIAIDRGQIYVSVVAAANYLLRVDSQPDGSAGAITRVEAPREMKNVDAIRAWKPGLVLFESNAFGAGPFGGEVTAARIEADRLALRTLAAGLNDPSSGVIIGTRVYFIESKYRLLTPDKGNDAAVPRGVPFDLQSVELPQGF